MTAYKLPQVMILTVLNQNNLPGLIFLKKVIS